MNKTYLPPQNSLEREWYVVDAADQPRSASQRDCHDPEGKTNPNTPHMDTGGFVIVVNADKVRVTGKKRTQKVYRRRTPRRYEDGKLCPTASAFTRTDC